MAGYGYYNYGQREGINPLASGIGGLAEGFNQAFNRYLDQRYQDNLMYQAQIAKTIGSIDIPETMFEENKQLMANKLNELRNNLISMTAAKKGFQRGQYGVDELMYVQQQASKLGKEFTELTELDRKVKQEMALFNDNTYDRQDMVAALNTIQEKKRYVPLLHKKAIDVEKVINSTYDAVGKIPGVDYQGKDGKWYEKHPYSKLPESEGIKNAAFGAMVQDEGGRRGLVKYMLSYGNPVELIALAAQSGMDQKSIEEFTGLVQAGLQTGNTRILEHNPMVQNMAVQWGSKYVKDRMLQDKDYPINAPKPDKSDTPELPYTEYTNKPMLDGTTAEKAYVFDKPIDASISSSDILDIHNNTLPTNKDIKTEIKEIGGKWAYGMGTYIKGTTPVTIPVKIKLRAAFPYVKSTIPGLKNVWAGERKINEVIRIGKDGKKHVFDAETHEYIRTIE